MDMMNVARLGEAFMSAYLNIDSPRVGLLNVGREDKKGTETLKKTYGLLKNSHLNFVGNIEGNEIFLDKTDVLVTNGLTGNILLKALESAALLCKEIGLSYLQTKKNQFSKKIDETFNYNQEGGAYIVGTRKPVIKLHGRAVARTMYVAIQEMKKLINNNYTDKLMAKIENGL